MIFSLLHWLRRWAAHATRRSLTYSSLGPTAEDNLGAGI
jgi:hypothetical protein